MKIYTRTGDKGQTSLVNGVRVSKASQRVNTYGAVDELNSLLGVVVAHLKPSEKTLKKELESMQHDLFAIGASLANPHAEQMDSLDKRVSDFEHLIDTLTTELPPLKNFILPGGGKPGSLLHMARTMTRRVERNIVSLMQKEEVDQAILRYFNRLSDLLFTMARYVNYRENKKETIWKR